jgi:hypothetical protein
MTMLSQGFAVLVAAALLSWRARVRVTARGLAPMAVAAVLAILTFLALSSFWGAFQGFRNERRANARVAPTDAAVAGGPVAGANTAFVEWLNWKLPPGAGYEVATTGGDEGTYQWLTYRLYPRRAIREGGGAHWVVFLRTNPKATGHKRSEFARVIKFEPDLLLAERRG